MTLGRGPVGRMPLIANAFRNHVTFCVGTNPKEEILVFIVSLFQL